MDVMNEENALIMVAPYGDLASARHDFDDLCDQVKQKRFELREAVLVSKNAEGIPTVIETRNYHARSGAGWGAGVGLLVGLLVPPLVASAAVGAAAGALVAMFTDHSLKSGLRHDVGQALAAGTAVVIAVLKPESRWSVERALSASATKSVVEFAESTIAGLETEIAKAMSTVTPDGPGATTAIAHR
jgi:uncharacterized membrane protein